MKKIYKILVADDSESYQKMIGQIFEIVGNNYELFFADNGKSACQIATQIIPDLILLDVIMPEMDGIQATRFLKGNESTSNIPIILLSGSENLNTAYEVGADDFISKPFNHYELLIKVRSSLSLLDKISVLEQKTIELETKQHLLEVQKEELLEDIRYSKRIQTAILPANEVLNTILPDRFIVNIPKTIVSGDFYWTAIKNNKKIVALADCTGHGVSGAFMTMAGIAFLKEILNKSDNLPAANKILFDLRLMVMDLLKHKGEDGNASDGLDISLVIIDEVKKTIEFAGANSQLYIFKNKKLEILKGDRMPIGIYLNFEKEFTNTTIDYSKEDIIYQFTDGFADQFGGPHNKKYRYKQFECFLTKIAQDPLQNQAEQLNTEFYSWKKDAQQVDDVLILGYKLK